MGSGAEIDEHLTNAFNKFDKDGSEEEINDSFVTVDKNNSGLIDLEEFKSAIKSDRLMELNLKQVFDKLGVKYGTDQQKYEAFRQKAMKRRLMKKQMEENMEVLTNKIITTLSEFTGVAVP